MLAEERHFTRSAARFHMAQPAFSQAIRRVERRLGVQLFERSSRSVVVTAAGEALAADGARILAAAALAVTRAQRAGLAESTLGIHITEPSLLLPRRILGDLRQAHPHIAVRQTTLATSTLVQALICGEIDVSVGPKVRDPACVSEQVAMERIGVLIGSDQPVASDTSITIKDLAEHHMVRLDETLAPDWNEFVESLLGREGVSPRWTASTAFGSFAGADVAVDSGAAMVCLASIGHHLPQGAVWLPLAPEVRVPWYVSWRAADSNHDGVSAFVNVARSVRTDDL